MAIRSVTNQFRVLKAYSLDRRLQRSILPPEFTVHVGSRRPLGPTMHSTDPADYAKSRHGTYYVWERGFGCQRPTGQEYSSASTNSEAASTPLHWRHASIRVGSHELVPVVGQGGPGGLRFAIQGRPAWSELRHRDGSPGRALLPPRTSGPSRPTCVITSKGGFVNNRA